MDIEKVFRNHAFLFFRLARRSSVVLSALDYFEERFDLSELDKDAQEEYGDSWGGWWWMRSTQWLLKNAS